jgi:hypothetical protein
VAVDLIRYRGACPYRLTVEVHRTRAASGDAAAEFGAGEFEMLTENPEKRCIRSDIDLFMLAIEYEGDHCGLLTRKTPGEKLLFDEGSDPRGIFRSTRLQIDRAFAMSTLIAADKCGLTDYGIR